MLYDCNETTFEHLLFFALSIQQIRGSQLKKKKLQSNNKIKIRILI